MHLELFCDEWVEEGEGVGRRRKCLSSTFGIVRQGLYFTKKLVFCGANLHVVHICRQLEVLYAHFKGADLEGIFNASPKSQAPGSPRVYFSTNPAKRGVQLHIAVV